MKPNHHFTIHIAQQIRNFRPVYEVWTFLSERLNGLLKQIHLNNWGGGMLEISMMRQFSCMSHIRAMVTFFPTIILNLLCGQQLQMTNLAASNFSEGDTTALISAWLVQERQDAHVTTEISAQNKVWEDGLSSICCLSNTL
jgi:hypothetical protein